MRAGTPSPLCRALQCALSVEALIEDSSMTGADAVFPEVRPPQASTLRVTPHRPGSRLSRAVSATCCSTPVAQWAS